MESSIFGFGTIFNDSKLSCSIICDDTVLDEVAAKIKLEERINTLPRTIPSPNSMRSRLCINPLIRLLYTMSTEMRFKPCG